MQEVAKLEQVGNELWNSITEIDDNSISFGCVEAELATRTCSDNLLRSKRIYSQLRRSRKPENELHFKSEAEINSLEIEDLTHDQALLLDEIESLKKPNEKAKTLEKQSNDWIPGCADDVFAENSNAVSAIYVKWA